MSNIILINEFTHNSLEHKYKNKLTDLSNVHSNQLNELSSASKNTLIKQDKFLKTNNLSKFEIN